MTTARKRWWRAVAIAAVGGGVIGGWFGLGRHQSAKSDQHADDATWTRTIVAVPAAPPAVPGVTEVARAPEAAPPTAPVTPAAPVPVPALLPIPSVPPPAMPAIEPAGGLAPPEKGAPPVAPVVPALPPAELPPLPVPPKSPEVKPVAPPAAEAPKTLPLPVAPPPAAPGGIAPVVPPLVPAPATAEPPKASPLPPPTPVVPSVPPVAPLPAVPVVPPPAELTPSLPPVKPIDPVQPAPAPKPDSDLKPSNPGNTLNPTIPQVAPAVPIVPPVAGGREAPGTPVDRAKPPETALDPSDRYVFPIPSKPTTLDPQEPHPRDDTMTKLTTTAAFAFLGGAMLAAEKAAALPIVPPAVPAPGVLVKADDPAQLKKDLEAATKRIDELERQVKKLTELLTGKKDELGLLANPKEPGAVEDVKALKDKIAALEKELNAIKSQTSLKPNVGTPEVKPKGIVKIVNEYPVEITMVINEKGSYRVAPNSRLEVEVPAGEFTYQLLQSGAPATRSVIKDKETVTLRIK